MNLKQTVALGVSLAFVAIIGISFLIIYLSFSSFRQEDFYDRLENKAKATAKLLFEVKEVTDSLLYKIEKVTPYKMWKESIVVCNDQKEIIFNSDTAYSGWFQPYMIRELKTTKLFRRKVKSLEMVGLTFQSNEDFHVFVAAEDKFGNSKNRFLSIILLVCFVLSTIIIALSTQFVVRKALYPLDQFREEITQISAKNLHETLPETSKKDEINQLTKVFNKMLKRIEIGFRSQASFTSHASHELRTPISRILFQLDNLQDQLVDQPQLQEIVKNIGQDSLQMSELISSLLTLARVDRSEIARNETVRMDELIFEVFENHQNELGDLRVNFMIEGNDDRLELMGSKSLLGIVVLNLLRNAKNYSSDKLCSIQLIGKNKGLEMRFSNQALVENEVNIEQIWDPFTRGKHEKEISGSGLGLSIVKRIIEYHAGRVSYQIYHNEHQITLFIPIVGEG